MSEYLKRSKKYKGHHYSVLKPEMLRLQILSVLMLRTVLLTS